MDKIKKIPKSESGCGVIITTKDREIYRVTNNPTTKKFTLWHQCEDGYIKIKTANSPLPLYRKIDD